jgi:hypothetical protein
MSRYTLRRRLSLYYCIDLFLVILGFEEINEINNVTVRAI